MSSALAKRLDYIEPLVQAHAGEKEESVYGVVDRVDIINGKQVPNFVRKWKGTIGNMRPTEEEPTIYLIEKLEPAILKHKKYKCFFGGRAGTKSIFTWDVLSGDVNTNGSKVFCMRERMKSLKESIYSGISERIKDIKLAGFTPVPSQWEIRHKTGGKFSFGGMQNIIDMKGSFNYKYFLCEEAARTKQATLDTLGPTLRNIEGAELWFVWNPESANDAMSTEFITPYQDELDRHGYYEDDYHLIIKVGYEDNPWFKHDDSLSTELEKDKEKVSQGRMSKARYAHIWDGAFSDDIENSIIEPDWFDACIDAHLKLGFDGQGATVVTHDPSDVGGDAKGYSARTGVVFSEVCELDAENGNRAMDVATGKAIQDNADSFLWDCDGMGALLRDQAATAFAGKKIKSTMYKGSEEVHNAEAIFKAAENYGFKEAKKNKEVFWNKRAQNSISLAERMRKTWEAVTAKEQGKIKYFNPDELISFSSHIKDLKKLRSECCKMPLKPNSHGKIALYSKDEMRRGIAIIGRDGSRIDMKIPSPNLFDCVVMSFDQSANIMPRPVITPPRPITPMGMRNVRTR